MRYPETDDAYDWAAAFCELHPEVPIDVAIKWFEHCLLTGKDAGNADLKNALQHILKVCDASRTQTRRLRWIGLRADCAIRGTDEWRTEDLPKEAESQSKRERVLMARVRALEEQLAEGQRSWFSKLLKGK